MNNRITHDESINHPELAPLSGPNALLQAAVVRWPYGLPAIPTPLPPKIRGSHQENSEKDPLNKIQLIRGYEYHIIKTTCIHIYIIIYIYTIYKCMYVIYFQTILSRLAFLVQALEDHFFPEDMVDSQGRAEK
jgi:hypothetical protein